MISLISKLVITFNFILNIQSQGCQTIVTRPEFRSLSAEQRVTFLNAVSQLHAIERGRKLHEYTRIHLENTPDAHGVPGFFPWHREFIRRFELELQQINPNIVLPYWDWTIDSQSPEQALVLTNTYFGSNGEDDNCSWSDVFGSLHFYVPGSHCLRRNFNGNGRITSFYSPEAMEAILSQSENYQSFWNNIEGGPHGAVHTGIGGSNGDMSFMHSPNDPLFYLHHAFVDLLWNEWQLRNPSLANTYSASVNDIMPPFNIPVSQVLNTQSPGYCYTYPRYSANLPNLSNSLTRRGNHTKSLANFVNYYSSAVKNSATVDYLDRTTPKKIRTPKPLPENYIINNYLNVQQVRQVESQLAIFVQSLNVYPGFTPAAEIHQSSNY